MKLSDAIMLGSTAVKPIPYGVLHSSSDGVHGCAFGMALYAVGIKDESELDGFGGDKTCPAEWWWAATPTPNPQLCQCKPDSCIKKGDYRGYIAHFFNEHVAKGKWTLEQLVDYVRSIEPAEEAEKLPEPTMDDGYEIDWRDAEGLTDVLPEMEMWRDKGAQ